MNRPNYQIVSAEFTRPNNATPYSIGDAVCQATPAILSFAGISQWLGGNGLIRSAWLRKSTNVVASASFRLHLFNTAVATSADNAALAIAWADRAYYIGQLTFANMLATASIATSIGETVDSVAQVAVPLPFACAAGAKDLYGLLEAAAAYTPGAQEQFQVILAIET
jgi:hypothetical protein